MAAARVGARHSLLVPVTGHRSTNRTMSGGHPDFVCASPSARRQANEIREMTHPLFSVFDAGARFDVRVGERVEVVGEVARGREERRDPVPGASTGSAQGQRGVGAGSGRPEAVRNGGTRYEYEYEYEYKYEYGKFPTIFTALLWVTSRHALVAAVAADGALECDGLLRRLEGRLVLLVQLEGEHLLVLVKVRRLAGPEANDDPGDGVVLDDVAARDVGDGDAVLLRHRVGGLEEDLQRRPPAQLPDEAAVPGGNTTQDARQEHPCSKKGEWRLTDPDFVRFAARTVAVGPTLWGVRMRVRVRVTCTCTCACACACACT